MRRPQLDLSALRACRWPRVHRAGLTAIEFLDSQARFSLTRRELLGIAGTAAASLPLKFGASEGHLQFVPGQKRLAFRLDGREKWAIDTRRFAGTPALRVERHDKKIRVSLTGARYPGTELPADLNCELTRAAAGWRMRLKMALGGFDGVAPFERWLRGGVSARSAVRLGQALRGVGDSSKLILSGRARAEFSPNWTLRLTGRNIARLTGFGGITVSDSVAIALLNAGDSSLMNRHEERRTLLAMNRGDRAWPFQPVLDSENASHFDVSSAAFDRIRIESGENAEGGVQRALIAESQNGKSGIAFVPEGGLRGSDGGRFRLALHNPRYAVVSDAAGRHAALVADYPRESAWVHAEGCSFEIGAGEDGSAFEVVSRNGGAARILCAPSLKRIAAPLPGVIVEPRAVPAGTELAFLLPPQNQENRITAAPRHQEHILLRGIQIKKKEAKKKKKKKKSKRQIKLEERQILLHVRPSEKKIQRQTEPQRPGLLEQARPAQREPVPRHPPTGQRTPTHFQGGGVGVVLQRHPKKMKALPHVVTPSQSQDNFGFDFIRPDDLLAIGFEFYNLGLAAGTAGSPSLVRVQPNAPAYMVVQFWPQHIAEEAYFEGDTPQPVPKEGEPPIPSRIAGRSRLAFIVPDNVAEIPYTVEALLDWAKLEQSVAPLATPPQRLTFARPSAMSGRNSTAEPQVETIQKSSQYYQQVEPAVIQAAPAQSGKMSKKERKRQARLRAQERLSQAQFAQSRLMELARVREPASFQTAIEAPYRMILSPNYYAGWAHSTLPVERGGQVELWHTRLGVRSQNGSVDEHNDFYRTVRAVWATDYQEGCLTDVKDSKVFNFPTINTRQRNEIVRLSSDPNLVTSNGKYIPQPIQVNRMMLSTLGAWMNTHGSWNSPLYVKEPACSIGHFAFNVVDWRHIAAMGRDQYVRIVEQGYLFPFGHRAVRVIITERKFDRTPISKAMGAYLRQQMFVVVREHEKNYPVSGQQNPRGPQIPFQTVRISTRSTPAVDPPKYLLKQQGAFWPRVNEQDFPFKMVGVDWEGNTTEFTAPLIFMLANPALDPGQSATIIQDYNQDPDATRRVRPFFGQKVAYAKNKVHGDTTFETSSISFKGEAPLAGTKLPVGEPYFYPIMSQSAVRIATVEQLTGRNAATSIEYDGTYLAQGIESALNKGQVFAKLVDSVPLAFGGSGGGSDKVGGLLTPNMDISGLSRLLGPVAGTLATVTSGQFDPKQFFQSALGAKLLGDISLADVINAVADFSGALDKVPKFVSTRLPNSIETSFTWQPEILDVAAGSGQPAYFVVTGDRNQALTVNAKLTKTLDSKPPSYEVSAVLKTFELHLVPSVIEVLVIKFNELSFKSVNGKKPDVKADLLQIEFTGPLSFVNVLKDLIPLDGFKDPPSLDITAQGIEMGYSLGVPPVSIGVFNLSNLSLGAQLSIPFTGDPITFQFDFCQEHQPFLLTVSIFGGGGYFGLTLTPKGIHRMAAEFEFGGAFALNLGVASGGVHLMAGLSYVHENGNTELTGYLRCGGSLEVLAVITVSVEFKMSMKYVSAGNKVWGRATLTVEVDILFFSTSVDLTVERQFAGGGSQHAGLLLDGAPYPLGSMPVSFADQMAAADWQAYCEAFA